ncbi:PREDICTED: nectin-4 [Ficedula albicollis]|uniref:nectin-4 n=1 Tax=Ficedula albicollis TaxID=59894 RepID=UPI0007AD8630|nr:PREDICTED: nectin-4 [Ficedula albicollis]
MGDTGSTGKSIEATGIENCEHWGCHGGVTGSPTGSTGSVHALSAGAGRVEVPRSVTAVLGQDVVLPCRYRAQEQEQVVQVTWLKRGAGAAPAEVAVLNPQHGEHVQEAFAGRVLRHGHGDLEDGAIVLRNAVQGDEGDYECHLITFPMGSFEGRLTLRVLGVHALSAGAGRVEVPRSVTAVLGQDVVLPCRYRAQEQEQVVQVTWLKRGAGAAPAEVAVLNPQHGEHVQEAFAGRVLRHGHGDLEDGAIVLRNAVQGDEGDYECHLITFPMGSFEGRLTLRVLDMRRRGHEGHGDMGVWAAGDKGHGGHETQGTGEIGDIGDAGDTEGVVGTGHMWDMEGKGDTMGVGDGTLRMGGHRGHGTMRSASVTSEFFLVPGRSMNGKSLTCVVAHPGLRHEKRITHLLSVAYLSDASVLGHTAEWQEGMEGAALTCLFGVPPDPVGCPPMFGVPPDPFGVPAEDPVRRVDLVSASVVVVGVIAAVLLCVLVIVVVVMTLYHKRKTQRISEKYCSLEETLQLRTESRQGSIRGDSLRGDSLRGDSLRGDSLRGTSICSAMPKEEEEEGGGGGDPIKQAMTHFVQENGMLQAKPSSNGIYINGRGHLV